MYVKYMKPGVLLIGLLVLLAAPAGVAMGQYATPVANPFAGSAAWIAYYSGLGIGLIHPDGTDNQPVFTGVPGESLLANWSPDGTKLVFTTRGGETEPLYEYDLAT